MPCVQAVQYLQDANNRNDLHQEKHTCLDMVKLYLNTVQKQIVAGKAISGMFAWQRKSNPADSWKMCTLHLQAVLPQNHTSSMRILAV